MYQGSCDPAFKKWDLSRGQGLELISQAHKLKNFSAQQSVAGLTAAIFIQHHRADPPPTLHKWRSKRSNICTRDDTCPPRTRHEHSSLRFVLIHIYIKIRNLGENNSNQKYRGGCLYFPRTYCWQLGSFFHIWQRSKMEPMSRPHRSVLATRHLISMLESESI